MEPIVAEMTASDGYRLRFRRWIPTAPARGTIVALHGIQSHSGWYDFSSRRLCDAGWEVRFLDRRGAGMNAEARGHARHADRLVHDVFQALDDCAPSRPRVLLGLSWAGRLAAVVAARRPRLVDRLVLLYPALASRFRPTQWQRLLLRLATAFDVLDRTAPVPLDDPALFTSDPTWQRFIRDDPLALHQATSGFFAAGADLEREARAAAVRIEMPTLLMLAGNDRIIDNDGVRRWFDRVKSESKTMIEFPGAAHTLEFEPCREEFVARLVDWLNR